LKVAWEADRGKAVCTLPYSRPVRKRDASYQLLQSLELPCVASATARYAPATSNPRVGDAA